MSTVPATVRRRHAVALFLTTLLLAMTAPVVAHAANTATFSARTPASASSTTLTRPTISVSVYDPYGVRGAGSYSMLVDGVAVSPSMSYTVVGSWNPIKGDYRRLKLSYVPATALPYGQHTVQVRIIDQKNRKSSSTWSFTVKQPVNTATFSNMAPAAGSESVATRPTISVTVYDRYGIRGSGAVSMRVDGKSVSPSLSYPKSGDYRTVRLSYRPASAMAIASHTVRLTVKDLKSRESTLSWSFDVIGPEPVYDPMPMPNDSDCASCHSGYPAVHPMQACALCHAEDSPRRPMTGLNPGERMTPYTEANTSAHSLGCSMESPCHGGGGPFPHVLDSDCVRCHNAGNASAPSGHTQPIEGYHLSPSTSCVGRRCHVSSLTVEHYRRVVDGRRLTCAGCHGSTDPKVIAAIQADSAACDSCHSFSGRTHPGTEVVHNATASCVAGGCHPSEASVTHDGNCSPCHAPSRTASLDCSGCHVAAHGDIAAAHTVPEGGCIVQDCHTTDVTSLHRANCSRCHATGRTASTVCSNCHGEAQHRTVPGHIATLTTCVISGCHVSNAVDIHHEHRCAACHAPDKTPSTNCSLTCHTGDLTTIHVTEKHDASGVGSCVSAYCHGMDAARVHSTGPGCSACHRSGRTPTLDCATCHTADLSVVHEDGDGKHDAPDSTCVVEGCHPKSVFVLHDAALSCASCHWTGEGLTLTCAECHGADLTELHSSADTSHTAPIDTGCIKTGCHAESNVAALHAPGPRCAACHAAGKTPSLDCADCHAGDQDAIHIDGAVPHETPLGTCVAQECHDSSVAPIHHGTCSGCHFRSDREPSIVCAECHGTDIQELHASSEASHAAEPNGCNFSACHATDVSKVHQDGIDCAACHASTATPSLTCANPACHTLSAPDIHYFAAGSHTLLGGPCLGSGCHADDVTVIHDPDQACGSCHSNGKTPSLICSVCHVETLEELHDAEAHTVPSSECVDAGCHGDNVTSLHSGSALGCRSCHSPGRTPSTTCSTCHPGTILSVHQDADLAHIVPDNTCVTAGCHITNGATVHAGGPNCSACHEPGVPASLTCMAPSCHPGDLAPRHTFAAEAHAVPSGTCVGSKCHAPDLATLHTNGPACSPCHHTGTNPVATCYPCHSVDVPALHVDKTTRHTAPEGSCVKTGCHFADGETIHQDAETGCNSCHAIGKTPSLQCSNCHTGLIHPGYQAAHGPHGCSATTCHYGDVTTIHGDTSGCGRCHSTTGVLPNGDCQTCHDAFLLSHLKPIDDPHEIKASGESTSVAACTGPACHRNAVTVTHQDSSSSCAACHAPNVTPSKSCTGCHTSVPIIAQHEAIPGRHDVPASNGCYWRCHFDPSLTTIPAPEPAMHGCQCHNGPESQVAAPRASVPDTAGVVRIHVAGPSCAACHAATPAPSTDCLDCHDEGAGRLVEETVTYYDEWSGETTGLVTYRQDRHSIYHYKACNYCHLDAHSGYPHSNTQNDDVRGGIMAPVVGAARGNMIVLDDWSRTYALCSDCHGQGSRTWRHPNPWRRDEAGFVIYDEVTGDPTRGGPCHCGGNPTMTTPF